MKYLASRGVPSKRSFYRSFALDTLETRQLLSANSDYVTHLYQALLNRAPDDAGLQGYTTMLDQGTPLATVVDQIRNSPEYMTNQITDLYHRFLHRDPDAAGLKYWLGAVPPSEPFALLQSIAPSEEQFSQDTQGIALIQGLFALEVGRAPSSSEFQQWQVQLSSDGTMPFYQPNLRSGVAYGIFDSDAARLHRLESYYHDYLHRDPDAAGLAGWQAMLTSGPVLTDQDHPEQPLDLQMQFLTSLEFAGSAGPVVHIAGSNTASYSSAADASNALTFDLLHKLAADNPNLVLSGYSAEAALVMAYQGAMGQTADEMRQVLHLMDGPIAAQFGTLAANLQSGSAGALQIANSIWVQQGLALLDSYTDALQQMASAGLHEVDFINATETARQAINAWVSDQTHAMIPELLPQGILDSTTRLALINAVYLDAQWAQPFDPNYTQDAPFFTGPADSSSSSVVVKMMSQTGTFRYADIADFQVVDMPYAGNDLSMLVFLPHADVADPMAPLAGLEAQLTPDNLTAWEDQMQPTSNLPLEIPRFKLSSDLSLKQILGDLGMQTAFSDGADFSGITTQEPLQIASVVQKAVIEVGEQGTKAAAATAVIARVTAVVSPPPNLFRADHPFLFAIRDNATGTLLFTGQVANPGPGD